MRARFRNASSPTKAITGRHTLVAFIDEHQDHFGGVEPILPRADPARGRIALSTYYVRRKRLTSPSPRSVRDRELKTLVKAVHETNYRVYEARKIWRALNRQGHDVARCTVERLRREIREADYCRATTNPISQLS
ncbi:IS3 family transposase [Streptomyces sp. MMS24-I2-30]|uniref:IS3 family transposase n=1 Tax=Streptomyces sp. MMS24-I2-30 TaxID=3351564 RepID=UPI003896B2C0